MRLSTTLVLASIQLTCYAQQLERRYDLDKPVSESYDYVIVGGGQAGLVLASRLSEDSSSTVLVIEAGDNGDALRERIDTPSSTYFNSITSTPDDWNYQTTPESNTNNRTIYWPRGKVLGGSSAMNAMYRVLPSQPEVDAWGKMAGDPVALNWNSLQEGMRRSETFTAPTEDVHPSPREIAKIQFNASSHGDRGPVHTSYPPFAFTQQGDFLDALENMGVWKNPDAVSGQNWGSYVSGSFINPGNLTRSYSRSGYIDSLSRRPNLEIITSSTVTRILFRSDDDPTATGVEFQGKDGSKQTVNAKQEVLLSAGAIGSPHLLLVSGVGPKSVLDAAGVKVQVNLPGVGQHLQDHLTNSVSWNTSADTAGSLYKNGERSPEFLSHVNSGVAYLNATYLFGNTVATFQKQVEDQSSLSSARLSQDPAIVKGYQDRYNFLKNLIPGEVGLVELLLNMMNDGELSVGVALQHPLSQGRISINSSSIFDRPLIEPNYLAHPADIVMLREGLKVARELGSTAPFNRTLGNEISPGPSVQSDEDWDKWIRQNTWTQFHPSCTCSMVPEDEGGVVDTTMKVYGTYHLRVIDGSVFPFLLSAHLGAPIYGLAEMGAKIVASANSGSSLLPKQLCLFASIGIIISTLTYL